MRRCFAATLACLIASGATALAQPATSSGDTEASKASENPITRWITLPLRYEADFLEGPYKATKDTYQISQAVVPFTLNQDWALITRTKLPSLSVPPGKFGEHWAAGLSNGYTTFFLSPQRGDGLYWGAGPLIYYPAKNNSALGVDKWGSGASVAFAVQNAGPWVFGAVANNIWSFGGMPNGTDTTNQLLLNPFASYHLADGWAIETSPQIIANWIATGGKWTVPVGGGVSKVVRVGDQPVKLAVDGYYDAIRPKAANGMWVFQFTVTFLLNKQD